MNSLTTIHLELTSRCNKGDGTPGSGCFMCGRRKMERDYPDLCNWGDMEYGLVKKIAQQVPPGIVIQFHWNGEPTLYPKLRDALDLFPDNIKQFDTNAKILAEKADEIIGRLDVLTISVIQGELSDEVQNQRDQVLRFITRKGEEKPLMVYRLLGHVEYYDEFWEDLPGIIARRTLHDPRGSFDYERSRTVPEIGICLDLLTHLAIDRYGDVSICVRFDPRGVGRIGNVQTESLEEIWNGNTRQVWLGLHKMGNRDMVPLCSTCSYWGVPG